jgi:hypothetical protein
MSRAGGIDWSGRTLGSLPGPFAIVFVGTVAAATLAAVSTLSQKGSRENEQPIFDIVVEAFQQLRVFPR